MRQYLEDQPIQNTGYTKWDIGNQSPSVRWAAAGGKPEARHTVTSGPVPLLRQNPFHERQYWPRRPVSIA